MGGGVGMKAASKVVGYTVTTGGLRAAENYPVSLASRKVASARPVSGGLSSAEDMKVMVSQSQPNVQRPNWELDDWEFAGGEEDVMPSAGERMPRLVFGRAPTLQEAREATADLTKAVERAYLATPNSVGYGSPVVADHYSNTSLPSANVPQTGHVIEKSEAPAVPANAIQAFRLLNDCSAAQSVVASIACDPNVWNAVLQNQELQEFLQSEKTYVKKSVANNDLVNASPKDGNDNLSDSDPDPWPGVSESGNGFLDIMQKIKVSVVDMMSSLSDFFQNVFKGHGAFRMSINDDGTARLCSAETVMEASFMGLAVMAIMVILLKRE